MRVAQQIIIYETDAFILQVDLPVCAVPEFSMIILGDFLAQLLLYGQMMLFMCGNYQSA